MRSRCCRLKTFSRNCPDRRDTTRTTPRTLCPRRRYRGRGAPELNSFESSAVTPVPDGSATTREMASELLSRCSRRLSGEIHVSRPHEHWLFIGGPVARKPFRIGRSCLSEKWSGRLDSNQRPPAPKASRRERSKCRSSNNLRPSKVRGPTFGTTPSATRCFPRRVKAKQRTASYSPLAFARRRGIRTTLPVPLGATGILTC